MLNNQVLLSSVSFAVAFGFSLIVNRDIKPALLTGLISVFATYTGVFVVNGRDRIRHKPTINKLEAQIYQLERQHIQLQQSISASATEKHRLEVKLNFLKSELSYIYTQISEQRSYLQKLSQDGICLANDRKQLTATLHELQNQVDNYEQREAALYKSLHSIQQEQQSVEANCESLRNQTNYFQAKIIELQNQKQELEQDLVIIKELKPQLKDNLYELQIYTQELTKQAVELKLSLTAIAQQKQTTEVNLSLLTFQILAYQEIKNKLEQELSTLYN